MRRAIVLAAVLLCIASAAFGAALKRTLFLVPSNESIHTGWIKLSIAGLISQAGGSYDVLYMNTNADSLAAELARARTSGKYGLVVIPVQGLDYLASVSGTPDYANGACAKYASIDRNPIGIPTVVVAKTYLSRQTGTQKIYSGATAASAWTYGAVGAGTAYDSLRCVTSEGDEILWHHGTSTVPQQKHLLYITTANEASYPWTVDVWPKHGANAAVTGSTICAWHVHHTEYDEAELPGAGQDSVIYYLPNYGSLASTGYDRGIKYMAALLKQYNCIREFAYTVNMDDLGFAYAGVDTAAVHYAARLDTLIDWLSANAQHSICNTQYCAVDTAEYLEVMQVHGAKPYIHFGWHPSNLYSDAAKSSSYAIFQTWGDGASEKALVLNRDLARDRYLLGTSGFLDAMDMDNFVIFASGDYNGIAGYNKVDSIFTALAANGADKFAIETSGYPGYYASSNTYMTIFYPWETYEFDLSWTGTDATKNVEFIGFNYFLLGVSAAGDTTWASPGLLSDSLIVEGAMMGGRWYRYFAGMLLNNGRTKDGFAAASTWAESRADWPNIYNLEWSGFVLCGHQYDTARRCDGTYYNMFLLWLQHCIGNLDAYNNLARRDDPGVGNVFQNRRIDEMHQRPGDQY